MAEEDRYSVAEFARRYKVAEANLEAFCTRFGLVPETIVTREEFKRMLDDYHEDSSPAEEESTNQGSAPKAEEERPEEENVSEEKKYPFARLARKYDLTPARVTVLRIGTGWKDDTPISEADLQAAIRKHLKNRSE